MPQAKGAASGEAGRVRKEFSVSEEWKGPCDQDVMSEQASKWKKWGEMCWSGRQGQVWDLTGSRGHWDTNHCQAVGQNHLSQGHSRLLPPCLSLSFLILSHLEETALISEAQRGRVTYLLQSTSQSLGGVLDPLVNCDSTLGLSPGSAHAKG